MPNGCGASALLAGVDLLLLDGTFYQRAAASFPEETRRPVSGGIGRDAPGSVVGMSRIHIASHLQISWLRCHSTTRTQHPHT